MDISSGCKGREEERSYHKSAIVRSCENSHEVAPAIYKGLYVLNFYFLFTMCFFLFFCFLFLKFKRNHFILDREAGYLLAVHQNLNIVSSSLTGEIHSWLRTKMVAF